MKTTACPFNPRYTLFEDGRIFDEKRGCFVKPCDDGKGYLVVCLEVSPKFYRLCRVHRLVAEAFVPGYAPGLVVNHLNEDKHDNRAVNLAWVTRSENATLHGAAKRGGLKRSHAVLGYADDNSFYAVYPSHHAAAAATGAHRSAITGCVNGHRKSAGGYRWRGI